MALVRPSDKRPLDFIYGFRRGSNFPEIFIHYLRLFLAQYGISLQTPVFEFRDKRDVISRLEKEGLSTASHQPLCVLTDVRYHEGKGDFNSDRGNDCFEDARWKERLKTVRVSQEPFFESFSRLLSRRFGVTGTLQR